MNVGGDADADVGGDEYGEVFDEGIFLIENPDREGYSEGYRGVT